MATPANWSLWALVGLGPGPVVTSSTQLVSPRKESRKRHEDHIAAVNHSLSVVPENRGGNLGGVSHFIDFNSINTLWLAAWQTLPYQCPCTSVFIVDLIGLPLSAGSRQEKGLETARDPPPWQPGCMFETTSFRSKTIRTVCQPNRSMHEPCVRSLLFVCEKERERECVCVCVCEGGVLLTLLAPDACTSTPLHPQQSTAAYEWV